MVRFLRRHVHGFSYSVPRHRVVSFYSPAHRLSCAPQPGLFEIQIQQQRNNLCQLLFCLYVHVIRIWPKILNAQARGGNAGGELPVNPAEEAEFMFIGKAMAHKSDRGAELVPIARSLAHLPENVPLEVWGFQETRKGR